MNKAKRIEQYVEGLATEDETSSFSPFYRGYFQCFNEQKYYEAHDVLEHLWLLDRQNAFYKGLIQIAGAFVHLQKQYLRPDHPKDGRRLRPAVRLFRLGTANLTCYRPRHQGLDVETLLDLCGRFTRAIEDSSFTCNPWEPATAPTVRLGCMGSEAK